MLSLSARRSTADFESTDFGDRSIDKRELGRGEGDDESDLVEPALGILLTLGVSGDVLLFGESDNPDFVAFVDLLFGVSNMPDLGLEGSIVETAWDGVEGRRGTGWGRGEGKKSGR